MKEHQYRTTFRERVSAISPPWLRVTTDAFEIIVVMLLHIPGWLVGLIVNGLVSGYHIGRTK